MENQKIITKIEPPIGWVIFNRPKVMNAFDIEMWLDLPDAITRMDKDPRVEIIILRGEGGVFSAGADIGELLEYTKANIAQKYADAVNRCFKSFATINKIIIAAVEGYALGGGCMVALSCDLRVAGKGTKIGIPLVKLGLAVEPLGIKRLLDVAGAGFAMEFLLTGKPIPPEKLLASGVVNYMVEDNEVVEFSEKLARRLLKNGKHALKTTKAIVKEFLTKGEPDWKFLRRTFANCMENKEFIERAQKFLSQRL